MTSIVNVICGGAIGAILGLRQSKVFTLMPAMLLAAGGTILNGVVTGVDYRDIGFDLLATVACLQIGYLVCCIATEFLMARTADRMPQLHRAVLTTIGQEPRAAFDLPQDLPSEMVALLTRLDEQHA
jgi:hypothetical protein